MELLLLFLLTGALLAGNLYFARGDYMNPGVLFCLVFFLAELMCLVFRDVYAIKLHFETLFVILTGLSIFTFVNILTLDRPAQKSTEGAAEIRISHWFVRGTVVLQIIAMASFLYYLRKLSIAHQGYAGSLSSMIRIYNNMTNYWVDYYQSLHLSVPMINRISAPIAGACAYLCLYIMVNNFIVKRKVGVWYLLSAGLLCVDSLLSSSRSPLFRMVTMVIIVAYVINIRKRKRTVGSVNLLRKYIWIIAIAGLFFLFGMSFIGRALDMRASRYVFIYTGAPIVNLDTFLTQELANVRHEVLGGKTFYNLYTYAAKLLHVDRFVYFSNVDSFMQSANGLPTGNVFTCFYSLIYDFGFLGMVPIFAIIPLYYCISYKKIMRGPGVENRGRIDYRLFLYGYLFNDLIMLFFSNRFYGTIFNAPFLKFFVLSLLIDQIFLKGRFRIRPFVPSRLEVVHENGKSE